ncbi:MAG: hypothetical protein ACRD1P_12725 [Thermoanaerobaculia bacterium]
MSARASIACFGRGLALSLSKPYLAVSLWLLQLLPAAVLILPVSNSLHALLDDSPAASRMVANPDYGWWETIKRMHPDLFGNFPDLAAGLLTREGVETSDLSGLRGIGATALSLAMLAVVLHAFALGGVFGTLREPHASLVTFGREGMRRFPAFLLFTLAALAAAGAAYRWVYLETGKVLRQRVLELDSEGQALAVTAVRLLLLLASLAAIKLLADSVRSVWVARPDLPPVSRFLAGIGAALSRPLRLAGVLAFYGVCTAALYLVWLILDPSAGGEARFALVPLILTQQVFVFVRLLLKVGYYAGISEALTRAPSPEYSYVSPGPLPGPGSRKAGASDKGALDGLPGGV